MQSAEEGVAAGLHEALTLDHPLPLIGELELVEESLRYGARRLLRLEDSGSLESRPSSGITQQRVPTLRTPTTLWASPAYRKCVDRAPAFTGQAGEVGL
jgi:hypothetical protein